MWQERPSRVLKSDPSCGLFSLPQYTLRQENSPFLSFICFVRFSLFLYEIVHITVDLYIIKGINKHLQNNIHFKADAHFIDCAYDQSRRTLVALLSCPALPTKQKSNMCSADFKAAVIDSAFRVLHDLLVLGFHRCFQFCVKTAKIL